MVECSKDLYEDPVIRLSFLLLTQLATLHAADEARVLWKPSATLPKPVEMPVLKSVRFRFQLTNAQIYAFWVSAEESGESGGYVAAGGPEFKGPRDH